MQVTKMAPAPGKEAPAPNQMKDRRRKRRVRISASVRVRSPRTSDYFEDLCTTVDVSRDGVLFQSPRRSYAVGQSLSVTFPYSESPTAINVDQPAEVVRVVEGTGGMTNIAVRFQPISAAQPNRGQGAAAPPAKDGVMRAAPVVAVQTGAHEQQAIRNLLEPEGYTVVIAANGAQALEMLGTHSASVVIAEMAVADMSGYDLCSAIKGNANLAHIPVVLISRSGMPADYAVAHSMGAVMCLSRPFPPNRLIQVVRLLAPLPKQTRSAYSSAGSRQVVEVERSL
jgi:CheY-like chemotaxis protein